MSAEPTWATQCRECAHLRQYQGGRIWKCAVLLIPRGVWRPLVGYAADARAPNGICGPQGKAFQRSTAETGKAVTP